MRVRSVTSRTLGQCQISRIIRSSRGLRNEVALPALPTGAVLCKEDFARMMCARSMTVGSLLSVIASFVNHASQPQCRIQSLIHETVLLLLYMQAMRPLIELSDHGHEKHVKLEGKQGVNIPEQHGKKYTKHVHSNSSLF